MKRWVSNLPVPPVQKWQSRAEILREYVNQQELTRLAELKSALEEIRRKYYAHKYDPNQPRVPAGNPDGGKWTSGTDGEGATGDPLESFAAARRRGRSVAYCLAQLTIDNLLCHSVEPASRRAVCRGQAMERYSACIVGRPIPPLSY